MERQLFDWEDWESVDDGANNYYNCVLKTQVGTHLIGEKFDTICVDFQKSILSLYNNSNPENIEKYQLIVSVGEKLES